MQRPQSRRHGDFGGLSPHKAPSPPNRNMKSINQWSFHQIFNVKTPVEDFLATVLNVLQLHLAVNDSKPMFTGFNPVFFLL